MNVEIARIRIDQHTNGLVAHVGTPIMDGLCIAPKTTDDEQCAQQQTIQKATAADVVEVVRCRDCKHRPVVTDESHAYGFGLARICATTGTTTGCRQTAGIAHMARGGLTMASDLIYREDAKDFVRHAYHKGLNPVEYLDEVPAADVVEVVRCKDCQYWRDAYVKENDGTERQYRDDDVDPLGMMGVTIDIGSNIGSMCLLENNCGWELNKSIFRGKNDFCSRGEKRPCSYEKWWGISDGIYPKPDIGEG